MTDEPTDETDDSGRTEKCERDKHAIVGGTTTVEKLQRTLDDEDSEENGRGEDG